MPVKVSPRKYESPRWSYEFFDCAMPMTFDTYSVCAFRCVYCFSFFQKAVKLGRDDYLNSVVQVVDVNRVKKMWLGEIKTEFSNAIKDRLVLQWGGLADSFDYYERELGVSLELLRFWRELEYPLSISTKGVWFVDDPRYREAFKDAKHIQVKASIIGWDAELCRKIELGVASPQERLRMLKVLKDLGVGITTLRLRPFIPGVSEKGLEELIKAAADAGVYSVSSEFLFWDKRASNVSRQRLKHLSEVLGYDVWEFFRKYSYPVRGALLRLNYDLKRPYYERLKELCDKYGLRLAISDNHHKEMCFAGGCCGLPTEGPLSNFHKGQFTQAIVIAKERGYVFWSDIKDHALRYYGEAKLLHTAHATRAEDRARYNTKETTLYEYLHSLWNSPHRTLSPAVYFMGVLLPAGLDENGDIIYLYNRPFVEHNIRVFDVEKVKKMVGWDDERVKRGEPLVPPTPLAGVPSGAQNSCG
jgi:DNA repair photolyase